MVDVVSRPPSDLSYVEWGTIIAGAVAAFGYLFRSSDRGSADRPLVNLGSRAPKSHGKLAASIAAFWS